MGVFSFLSRATTWWNRETLGTQLHTWRKGIKVGEDGQVIFFLGIRTIVDGGLFSMEKLRLAE